MASAHTIIIIICFYLLFIISDTAELGRTSDGSGLVELDDGPEEVEVVRVEDVLVLEEGHVLLPDAVVDRLGDQLGRLPLLQHAHRVDGLGGRRGESSEHFVCHVSCCVCVCITLTRW